VLAGWNAGSVSGSSGKFAGIRNLSDTNGGTLAAEGATQVLTGPGTSSVMLLTGIFAEMVNVTDRDCDG
jgi:hypothetical protein